MEPENRGTVLGLLREVRRNYPGKDIWCYTGYDLERDLLRWKAREELQERNCSQAGELSETAELLSLIDVLVDGPFVEERKNLRLAFRGSDNQRLIDVRTSVNQGQTVCLTM